MKEKGIREDIKGKRESHMSSPVGNDTEFHLRTAGLSTTPQVDKYYYVCFKTLCTSKGDDSGVPMARFVQMGKPDVLEDGGSPVDKEKIKAQSPNDKLKGIAKRQFNAK
jgi:hypothetical protein